MRHKPTLARVLPFLGCLATCHAAPMPPDDPSVSGNLIAWYKSAATLYNPATGVWTDSSGQNNHTATASGDAPLALVTGQTISDGGLIDGQTVDCVASDGDTDLIGATLNSGTPLGRFSIIALTKYGATNNLNRYGFGSYRHGDTAFNFNLSHDGTVRKDNGSVGGDAGAVPADFFVRGSTFDSGTIFDYYVTETGTTVNHDGHAFGASTPGTADFYLGDVRDTFSGNQYAQVAVYDTVLTQQQIEDIAEWMATVAGASPVPTLSTASSSVSAPFTVDVSFTEPVGGLEESDFTVVNGSVTPASLTGSADAWSVGITPAANGDVEVTLPAGSVTDLDGDNAQNVVSNTLVTEYLAPGSDRPDVVLSTPSNPVPGPYTVEIVFDEPVSGLAVGDFEVTNGSASNLTGSGAIYTVLITATENGDVTVVLPAGSATDLDGDLLTNSISNALVTTVQLPDYPAVAIYGPNASPTPEFEIFLTFAEAITGLTDGDFQIVNGTASGTVSTSTGTHDTYANALEGRYYKTTITATAPGNVEVTLPAGAVTDTDGDNVTNPVSNTLVTNCSSDFGERWIVDDHASWTANTGTNSNLAIADGFAEPTANSAQFTSITKTFPVKMKAEALTLTQSPVWDNWTGVSNIQPTGAGDAPILVPVGDNNYYFLGLGSSGGYHAWHSTDMVNWTHRGPVTPPGEGRWVTSAEYKDGEFYIYSDDPNDHNPHLFKDADLDDGVPGTDMGLAFVKETSGSDCSLIRSTEDGLFHIIYEDWSPIKARDHSWDSPLAGHTTSVDGLNGFNPHEHQPPIDHRTTPNGTIAYYNHPNRANTPYEVHTPTQDAFGDWTSIQVGSRFWLFSDYDSHDGGIKVARFASDSIYKQFELVGSIGSGHPDPTVGFAEGKFYLITQMSTDYTSPGPWVDGVEARAGVDTDGNGSIDQWTDWRAVAEQYDYTPNFIRVVTLTPARLDLSSLPPGYGFQYEFRVDDTVVSGVSPIMDRVEMEFVPSNFQDWSDGEGTSASENGDHNHNSIPNLIEFAIGQSSLPERQADGTLTMTAVSEALEDGYAVEFEFSEDLDTWTTATGLTSGVQLLDTTVHPNGDREMVYDIQAPNGRHVFWRIAVF